MSSESNSEGLNKKIWKFWKKYTKTPKILIKKVPFTPTNPLKLPTESFKNFVNHSRLNQSSKSGITYKITLYFFRYSLWIPLNLLFKPSSPSTYQTYKKNPATFSFVCRGFVISDFVVCGGIFETILAAKFLWIIHYCLWFWCETVFFFSFYNYFSPQSGKNERN